MRMMMGLLALLLVIPVSSIELCLLPISPNDWDAIYGSNTNWRLIQQIIDSSIEFIYSFGASYSDFWILKMLNIKSQKTYNRNCWSCALSSKLIFVSDLIEINAPSNVSVGEGGIVEVRVYYPNVEELGELAGTPAALTKLTASTTLGNLTEVNTSSGELTNNSGKCIVLYTNESGVALIQIKSDEPGKANITVNAPAISDLLNMLRGNESTAYLVMNQITVDIVTIQTWQWYDQNQNSKIEDNELINAIMDWLNGQITDEQLINVILKWLS